MSQQRRGGSSLEILQAILGLLLIVGVIGIIWWFVRDPVKAPGDKFEMKQEFEFYFDTGNGTYKEVPQGEEPLLINDASWKVPEGVTLESPTLTITTAWVSWKEGSLRCGAAGYRIKAACTVQVAEDAQPGSRKLVVDLPNLVKMCHRLGATAVRQPRMRILSASGQLEFKEFKVDGSCSTR